MRRREMLRKRLEELKVKNEKKKEKKSPNISFERFSFNNFVSNCF